MLGELPPELRDTPLGREFRRRFGNRREQVAGAGSGFIIDPSGIIVTNNHVVDHADKIVVSLTDGRRLPATVIGRDELTDVAVIKVQTQRGLAQRAWGDSRKAEVGDWILAAGNPFGLGGSVSVGIISAEGRDLGPGRSTISCSSMRRSIPATPAARCSIWTARSLASVRSSSRPPAPRWASASPFPARRSVVSSASCCAKGSIERGWLGVAVDDRDGGVTDRQRGPQRAGGASGYTGR